MSDTQSGPDWWLGADGKWYPPVAAAPPPPTDAPISTPDDGVVDVDDPAAADETADTKRRRWIVPAAIAAAVIILAAGGAVVWKLTSDWSPTHQLTGSITLQDAVDTSGKTGKACSGKGGYDDMRSGGSVTVSDDTGKILATGMLGSGSTVLASPGLSLTYCEFPILLEKKLPKRDFYVVEVTHRGKMNYSYNTLEAQDWELGLTLG